MIRKIIQTGIVLIMICCHISLFAENITLKINNVPLKTAIETFQDKYGYLFIFASEDVNTQQIISLDLNNVSVDAAIKQILQGQNVEYEIYDKNVVIHKQQQIKTLPAESNQTIVVTGTVTDKKGEPLPGVSVSIKGTTLGISTDINGNFSINVPTTENILTFSYIGFTTREIVVGNKKVINVILVEDVISVGEVVVVGYGVQKKATITGAISSVGNSALVQTPVASVGKALAGRVTGLIANQYEGDPGNEQPVIRIRGRGTFAGSSDPLVLVDGVENSSFNNIDFNEIEDITVLKDASATAVYGMRGANGVIIITTKRGKEGKPIISLSSNVGMLTFTDLRENLRAYDFAINYNEARKYDSFISGVYNPKYTDKDIEHFRTGDDPIMHPDTDWFSVMMQPTSMQTQHNINIRGGMNMMKYFVSAGYLYQEGLFNNFPSLNRGYNPNISYQRYNIRANFDFDLTKQLSVNVDLSSIIANRSGFSDGSSGATRTMVGMTFYAPPYSSPGVIDGKIVEAVQAYAPNPILYLMSSGYSRNYSNNLTTNVGFNYKLDFITNGLKLHAKINNWNQMNNQKRYTKNMQSYQAVNLDDGTILYQPLRTESPFGFSESNQKKRDTYFEAGLNYERTFNSHAFGGLLLYNQKKLYDPNLLYDIPNAIQGLIGRITYNYKMRYMAEFNIAYNGTENFAPGKRFGLFPAYSLGWIPTEESFFPKNKIVTYIKLRGSYGEVGNDKIGGSRFLYMPSAYIYASGSETNGGPPGGFWFGVYGSTLQNYQASYESSLGNPNLTWERTKKTDIGIDLILLKDRIRLTFDYFLGNTNNILTTPQTTPQIVGITLPAMNWGKVVNKGYDGDITYTDHFGKFDYWIKGNYSFARNKILFQDEVPRRYPYMMRTGQSMGQAFGYIAEGFYNTWEEVNVPNRPAMQSQNSYVMPGDVRYKDVNGDGRIDQNDQVPIGYPDFPEVSYGISFGGSFKGFDFSVLFQGATNYSRGYVATNSHIRPFDNALATLAFIPKYSWSQEKYENGETIRLPRLTADMSQSNNYATSTFMVQDFSYLRLKNAEIGYSFKNELLNRFKISSLRIYLNGNNLLTWSGLFPGIDPEQGLRGGDESYYPMTRVFNLGFNIQF